MTTDPNLTLLRAELATIRDEIEACRVAALRRQEYAWAVFREQEADLSRRALVIARRLAEAGAVFVVEMG